MVGLGIDVETTQWHRRDGRGGPPYSIHRSLTGRSCLIAKRLLHTRDLPSPVGVLAEERTGRLPTSSLGVVAREVEGPPEEASSQQGKVARHR